MGRVVITGMGIWSCLGQNLDQVRASLFEGKSGIGIDPARKEYGYRSLLTGIVPAPVLKGVLDRRLRAGPYRIFRHFQQIITHLVATNIPLSN